MEYSGAGGKLIHEKNQMQKISWHCPFKHTMCPWRYSPVKIATITTTTKPRHPAILYIEPTYHVQDVDWFSVVLQLVSLKNLQVTISAFSPFSFRQLLGLFIQRFVVQEEKETLKTICSYIFSCKNMCKILTIPFKCSSSLVIHI